MIYYTRGSKVEINFETLRPETYLTSVKTLEVLSKNVLNCFDTIPATSSFVHVFIMHTVAVT